MTIHPRNVVLALVLAALCAASFLFERPSAVALERGPLAPGFDPAAVEKIELAAGDGAPLTLARQEGTWRVVERDGFKAYAFAVDELLARVRGLQRSDKIGAEAAAHELQGVGAAGTRLTFEDAAGRTLLALVQGAPAGLAAGSNVRLAGENDVYRAPTLPPTPTAPAAWLDTHLVSFQPASVRAVVLSHGAGGALDLLRDEQGWRVQGAAGGRAPRTRVERLLQVASNLIFADVLDAAVSPETGFGTPPEALLELELEGGERQALWVGRQGPDGAYYATNPHWEKPWCVALPAATAEVLFAALDDVAAGAR